MIAVTLHLFYAKLSLCERHTPWIMIDIVSNQSFVLKQNVSVLEQEKIDKLMLDMDGTENKCKHIKMIKCLLIIPWVARTEFIHGMKA